MLPVACTPSHWNLPKQQQAFEFPSLLSACNTPAVKQPVHHGMHQQQVSKQPIDQVDHQHLGMPAPLQAEAGDHSFAGSSIMAGDDAHLPMLSYPTNLQEPLDLCIDVTVRHC